MTDEFPLSFFDFDSSSEIRFYSSAILDTYFSFSLLWRWVRCAISCRISSSHSITCLRTNEKLFFSSFSKYNWLNFSLFSYYFYYFLAINCFRISLNRFRYYLYSTTLSLLILIKPSCSTVSPFFANYKIASIRIHNLSTLRITALRSRDAGECGFFDYCVSC